MPTTKTIFMLIWVGFAVAIDGSIHFAFMLHILQMGK